eukprot:CAMPEP_0169063968 /NCGR_PEP_ID=MMETSP1015-20121227/1577_1 /TAXON_ID=342587 /ORGANISM="Karlodinium micrum, Strain CCMP2283" /LENGTH=604 /DNA_ID=CAMNT_0009122359 /DNA_START=1 /DNA_END=1815 /DNA_ORIENTATION=-
MHPNCNILYATTKEFQRTGDTKLQRLGFMCLWTTPWCALDVPAADGGPMGIELGCPRGQEGSPLIFVLPGNKRSYTSVGDLTEMNTKQIVPALMSLQINLIIGVDNGGDSISGGVDWKDDADDGRDRQMLYCIMKSEIPFLHVVLGPGCDGETEESAMRACCSRLWKEGSLIGSFAVLPLLEDMRKCSKTLPPTKTPNLMWGAQTGDLRSKVHPDGRSGDYVCITRGRRNTYVPRVWLTKGLVFCYDGVPLLQKASSLLLARGDDIGQYVQEIRPLSPARDDDSVPHVHEMHSISPTRCDDSVSHAKDRSSLSAARCEPREISVLCFNVWNQVPSGDLIGRKYHNIKARMDALVGEVKRLNATVLIMPEYKPNLQLEYLQELDAMYFWDDSEACKDPKSASGGCVKIGVRKGFERRELGGDYDFIGIHEHGSKGNLFQIRAPGATQWISIAGVHLASGANNAGRRQSLTWIFEKLCALGSEAIVAGDLNWRRNENGKDAIPMDSLGSSSHFRDAAESMGKADEITCPAGEHNHPHACRLDRALYTCGLTPVQYELVGTYELPGAREALQGKKTDAGKKVTPRYFFISDHYGLFTKFKLEYEGAP